MRSRDAPSARDRRRRLAALGLALVWVAIAVTAGATAGTTQGCLFCGDCASPGGWVSVPATRASDVASVTVRIGAAKGFPSDAIRTPAS
ncbi:MAG: hypothetical protein WCJ30_20040, partial [Deltaproteobacteria bacterium]